MFTYMTVIIYKHDGMARYRLSKKKNRINARKDGLWFAQAAPAPKMGQRELFRRVTTDTTLSEHELALAIELLADRLPALLADGILVRLGRLGTLHVEYGSEGVERPEDFHPRLMRRPRVVFRPSAELRTGVERAMHYEQAGLSADGISFGSVESYRRWEQENGRESVSASE